MHSFERGISMSSFFHRTLCGSSRLALVSLATACLQSSPFETRVDDDERSHTQRNLQALARLEPPTGAFRFAAFSDSHQFYEELCALVDLLNAREDLSFAVHLGDMAQAGLLAEFRWTLDCLAGLDIPWFTAVGNHDLLSNGAFIYREMFGPFDYTVTFADARLVVFNGNYFEAGKPSQDIAWLSNTMRSIPTSDTILVLAHQPPPAGNYAGLLNRHHVTAQITAHTHVFTAGRIGSVSAYEVGTAQLLQWLLVEVDDAQVDVSFCVASNCSRSIP
jgi:hypothetical protein